MGCGYDYICRTCKKSYYVGYGSHGTWFDDAKTVAEWQAHAMIDPRAAELHKNQCILKVLTEHDGHAIYPANWDYHDKQSGVLTGQFGVMGSDVEVIPDYAEYEHIDFYDVKE